MIACAFNCKSVADSVPLLSDNWIDSFRAKHQKLVLVGAAAMLWAVWRARNRVCFRHKRPNDPTSVVFSVCYWLDFWSILQEGEQEALRWGGPSFWVKWRWRSSVHAEVGIL